VVGASLDRFDRRHVGRARIFGDASQPFMRRRRQCGERCSSGPFAQGKQPCAFDARSLAHEARFAEYFAQCTEFGRVPAIERGQGIE